MNIFEIADWNNSTSYKKNNIVKIGGTESYWYAALDHTGGDVPSTNNPNWVGQTVFGAGEPIPKFIWAPSYNVTTKVEAKTKEVQFGDGYKQIVNDGINNTLLELDFSFEGRDDREAGAILHFLTTRAGGETFAFTPPSPYSVEKKWKCKAWSSNQVFYDNHTIRATFIEVLI